MVQTGNACSAHQECDANLLYLPQPCMIASSQHCPHAVAPLLLALPACLADQHPSQNSPRASLMHRTLSPCRFELYLVYLAEPDLIVGAFPSCQKSDLVASAPTPPAQRHADAALSFPFPMQLPQILLDRSLRCAAILCKMPRSCCTTLLPCSLPPASCHKHSQ